MRGARGRESFGSQKLSDCGQAAARFLSCRASRLSVYRGGTLPLGQRGREHRKEQSLPSAFRALRRRDGSEIPQRGTRLLGLPIYRRVMLLPRLLPCEMSALRQAGASGLRRLGGLCAPSDGGARLCDRLRAVGAVRHLPQMSEKNGGKTAWLM